MRDKALVVVLIAAIALLVAVFALAGDMPAIVLLLGLALVAGFLAFLALIVLYILAPRNWWFTFVKEGTAKVVVRAGKFHKVLIQWEGRTFSSDWSAVEEAGPYREPWHPFGGLRLFSLLWPLDSIYTYKLRWSSLHTDGSVADHEEVLDYVLLKDFLYFAQVTDAEDSDMVPLTIGLLITARVVNPYKALFAVEDWLEMVMNRIRPLFREFVASCTWGQLVREKQAAGQELWNQLSDRGLIHRFELEYGVHIESGGIEMKDVSAKPEYQEAATRRYLAERTAERRAAEIVGTALESMARARGKSLQAMQRLVQRTPGLQREFLDLAKDLMTRSMAIDGGSFVDIRVGGAEGIEASLLNLLAAWQRMPTGKAPAGGPKQAGKEAGVPVEGLKPPAAVDWEAIRRGAIEEEEEASA